MPAPFQFSLLSKCLFCFLSVAALLGVSKHPSAPSGISMGDRLIKNILSSMQSMWEFQVFNFWTSALALHFTPMVTGKSATSTPTMARFEIGLRKYRQFRNIDSLLGRTIEYNMTLLHLHSWWKWKNRNIFFCRKYCTCSPLWRQSTRSKACGAHYGVLSAVFLLPQCDLQVLPVVCGECGDTQDRLRIKAFVLCMQRLRIRRREITHTATQKTSASDPTGGACTSTPESLHCVGVPWVHQTAQVVLMCDPLYDPATWDVVNLGRMQLEMHRLWWNVSNNTTHTLNRDLAHDERCAEVNMYSTQNSYWMHRHEYTAQRRAWHSWDRFWIPMIET